MTEFFYLIFLKNIIKGYDDAIFLTDYVVYSYSAA